MPEERWRRLEELFGEALAMSPAERTVFLEQACGTNSELRAQIEGLLAAQASAGSLLKQPPIPAHEMPGRKSPTLSFDTTPRSMRASDLALTA